VKEKRINPETGVLEENHISGWAPIKNADGHAERINPETGVREEDHFSGWAPIKNADSHAERTNAETGVYEEDHFSGWAPNRSSADQPRRSPSGSVNPRRSQSQDVGGSARDPEDSAILSSFCGSTYSSSSLSAPKPKVGGLGSFRVVLWLAGSFVGGYVGSRLTQQSPEFSLPWCLGSVLVLIGLPGLIAVTVVVIAIAMAFDICSALIELVKKAIS
jgi:hypothetical protein